MSYQGTYGARTGTFLLLYVIGILLAFVAFFVLTKVGGWDPVLERGREIGARSWDIMQRDWAVLRAKAEALLARLA